MKNNKRKGIPAAAFFAGFSSHDYAAPEVSQKPSTPKVMVVDRWDGQKWIEVRLEWNGTEYKETR